MSKTPFLKNRILEFYFLLIILIECLDEGKKMTKTKSPKMVFQRIDI